MKKPPLILPIFFFLLFFLTQLFGTYCNYAQAQETSFSFAIFGDNQGNLPLLNDLILKLNSDKSLKLVINVGDLVSSPTEQNYQEYLSAIKKLTGIKVYFVPGNHDVYGKNGYPLFRRYCGDTYYSFDFENSHFIILDNALSGSFNWQQLAWLKNDLSQTNQRNIFIFMHKPLFDPSEIYQGYVMSGRKTSEELMALFKKYRVKAVFAGHIHGYAKGVRDGTSYFVTGGAGGPLHLPREFGGFFHYVKITVVGDKIMDTPVMLYE